jgi:hypothetical protein
MRVVEVHNLYLDGWRAQDHAEVLADTLEGVRRVSWPPGNDRFVLGPLVPNVGHPNGVVPVRAGFANHMFDLGWSMEFRYRSELLSMHGALDAVKETRHGLVGVEWETGNISSSHRALGKLTLGLVDKEIVGGILVVLDSRWKAYFTDRIGNWGEVDGYQRVWSRALRGERPCFLSVVVYEPDGVEAGVIPIPKGRDGNAFAARVARREIVL